MTIVTNHGVNTVVNRLQTIGVGSATADPCRISELREVAVGSEEVVHTVAEVDLVVGKYGVEKIILAACR